MTFDTTLWFKVRPPAASDTGPGPTCKLGASVQRRSQCGKAPFEEKKANRMSSEESGGWPGPPRPGLALNLTLRGGSSALGEIIACRELQTAACSKHTGRGMDGSLCTGSFSSDGKTEALNLEMKSRSRNELQGRRGAQLASLECGHGGSPLAGDSSEGYEGYTKMKTWGSHQQTSLMSRKKIMGGYFSLLLSEPLLELFVLRWPVARPC